jgi:hypothetical protein
MANGVTKNRFYGLGRLPRFFLMSVNLLVLARHMLLSAWVLFGGRQEVVTGHGYQWPMTASVLSAMSFLASSVFAVSLLGVMMNKWRLEKAVVACLAFFTLREIYESIMLHVLYGPMKITDFSAYLYGPLVAVLVVVNWWFLLRKQGPRP